MACRGLCNTCGVFHKLNVKLEDGVTVYHYAPEVDVGSKEDEPIQNIRGESVIMIIHNPLKKEIEKDGIVRVMDGDRPECKMCCLSLRRAQSLLYNSSIKMFNDEIIGVCNHCKTRGLEECNKCTRCNVAKRIFREIVALRRAQEQKRLKSWLQSVKDMLETSPSDFEMPCSSQAVKEPEIEDFLKYIRREVDKSDEDMFTAAGTGATTPRLPPLLRSNKTQLQRRVSQLTRSSAKSTSKKTSTVTDSSKRKGRKTLSSSSQKMRTSFQEKSTDTINVSFKTNKKDGSAQRVEHIPEELLEASYEADKDSLLQEENRRRRLSKQRGFLHSYEDNLDFVATSRRINISNESFMNKYFKNISTKSFVFDMDNELGPLGEYSTTRSRGFSKDSFRSKSDIGKAAHSKGDFEEESLGGASSVTRGISFVDRDKIKIQRVSRKPIFFHVKYNSDIERIRIYEDEESPKGESDTHKFSKGSKGLFYKLSEKEFIEMGWTRLPERHIYKKIKLFELEQKNSKFDWFQNHKGQQIQYFDARLFADIFEDGTGTLFYCNGRIALEHKQASDEKTRYRYNVYDYKSRNDVNKDPILLASFDWLGNGIVYDRAGKVRMSYNQAGGCLLDSKLGPRSGWSWHNLNIPHKYETLESEYILSKNEIVLAAGPKISDVPLSTDANKENVKPEGTISFTDLFKRPRIKKFQYQLNYILAKSIKINEQFSLKILRQDQVYLIFDHYGMRVRLNLGFVIKNKVILKEALDNSPDLYHPLEDYFATGSVAALRETVTKTRHYNLNITKRDERIRRPFAVLN